MKTTPIQMSETSETQNSIPTTLVHTLVIGSGAAGLNAAVQLIRNGVEDILLLTEGLSKGTSINTGSDKQTYYKLAMCGEEADSPRSMADSYMAGGAMHGDIALIESALSARAFLNLVNLGVPFPRDQYGQFVGYKTDHDPLQRATSIGPYTSREMCRKLYEEAQRLNIPIREGMEVIELIVLEEGDTRRAAGVLGVDAKGNFEAYIAENVIFAVGGPGGIYKTSVYPAVHFGGIGLALMAGAKARNLTESQFGLASIKFRWNVSGTYMQVIPRFISRAKDGETDEREFLIPFFSSPGTLHGNIFLKGYQWPFDASKVVGGSSLIDLLVYIETMVKNRRVFLDFRKNPKGFSLEELPEEAHAYLVHSKAKQATPISRLMAMNPDAVELYKEHGINLAEEPLEISVCAQHNNGGLAGTKWWESTNMRHLFPIGEVNGSHGVSRPGGSALNSGQVGGIRAAEFIANRYSGWSIDIKQAKQAVQRSFQHIQAWQLKCNQSQRGWKLVLKEIRERMSLAGGHIRSQAILNDCVLMATHLVKDILTDGCHYSGKTELKMAFRVRQLCLAHLVYLKAIAFNLESKVGSRGSSIVLDPAGQPIHPLLDDHWKILPENPKFREKVLETQWTSNGEVSNQWMDCISVPGTDSWFETTWAEFGKGEIYNT
jgi:succinate dehydrogenase/fumarate reductase flavoprotein subunit